MRESALSRLRHSRGAALILVLWTFSVLSVLAGEFARAMREDALSTRNFRLQTTGQYIAMAAINEAILAMITARDDDLDDDPDDEEIPEQELPFDPDAPPIDSGKRAIRMLMQGDGRWVRGAFAGIPYEVRAIDEGGKIAINQVDVEVIRLVMLNLGYEELTGDTVADSIADWIDEDDLHRINGAEEDFYDGLPRPYPAKNAPLEAIEELLLVRGVTRSIFYGGDGVPGLREIFSVFATNDKLNLRSIRPEVMIAISGIPEDDADELRRRRNRSGENVSEELRVLVTGSGLGTPRESALTDVTIEARVKDAAGRIVAHVGAVVKVRNGFRTYRWYDSVFEDDGEAS